MNPLLFNGLHIEFHTALGATERLVLLSENQWRQPTDFQRQKHYFHFVKVLFFIALINEQPAQLKDRIVNTGVILLLTQRIPGSHILPGVRLVAPNTAKVCLYALRLGAAVASGSMAFLRAQNKHLDTDRASKLAFIPRGNPIGINRTAECGLRIISCKIPRWLTGTLFLTIKFGVVLFLLP
jgi:hypothetical protein